MEERGASGMPVDSPTNPTLTPTNPALSRSGARAPPLLFQFPALAPQMPPSSPFWPMQHPALPMPPPLITDFNPIQSQQQQQQIFMHPQQGGAFQFSGFPGFQSPDLNRPASPPVYRPHQEQQKMGFSGFSQQPNAFFNMFPSQQAPHLQEQVQHVQQQAQHVQRQGHQVQEQVPQQTHRVQEQVQHVQQQVQCVQRVQQQVHNVQQQVQHAQRQEQHENNENRQVVNTMVYPAPLCTHKDVVNDDKLFFKTLLHFYQAIGRELVVPKFSGKHFDIHRLYCEVTEQGGLEKVTGEKKWTDIATAFDIHKTVTNPVFFLRMHYENLLHHYEQVYFHRKQGPFVPPPGALPKPVPLSEIPKEFIDLESSKKKRGRNKFDQVQTNTKDPVAPVGNTVTGAIEGKFEHGYFVTVVVGSEKLRGVIYNVPQCQTSKQQFTQVPEVTKYVPRKGSDDIPELAKDIPGSKKREYTKNKNPHAIKSPRSGYNFFVSEERPKLTGTREEISRMVGDLWNSLSQEQRMRYIEMAQRDKERYNREKREREEAGGETQVNNDQVNANS